MIHGKKRPFKTSRDNSRQDSTRVEGKSESLVEFMSAHRHRLGNRGKSFHLIMALGLNVFKFFEAKLR